MSAKRSLTMQAVYLLLAGLILYVDGLARRDFIPFGTSNGDTEIYRNDDDNTLELCPGPSVPYTFFGKKRSCFYISNNGIITFSGLSGSYSEKPYPRKLDTQIIAPFYGDVDTRGSGTLSYRVTTSEPDLFSTVDDLVHQAFAKEAAFASRHVTVATWNEVGYYDTASDLLNTFQCVMASDGQNLFVFFLYADIQWIRNAAEIPPAQVGFNAGDGVHYYVLPGSRTEGVANVTTDSNMGVPGMWAFKVSGTTVESAGCPVSTTGSSGTGYVPTCLSTSYGNQLGGDLISIQGPFFSSVANIQCVFDDGITRVALYESGFRVHCAVPLLPRSGRVPLRLLINGRVQGEATYTALPMERAHRVEVNPHSSLALPLVFTDDTAITLSWNPQHIFPQVNPDLEPFNVDVLLYTFNVDSAQWVEHSILADNIDNDGSMLVTIPFGISDDVVAMAIQVATSLNANAAITSDGLYMKLFRAGQRVGIWSAEYYYVNPNIARMTGRGLCQNWNTQEPIPDSLVAGSTPCAPTVQQAQLASSGLSEIVLDSVYGSSLYSRQWADTFHPGTSRCFKQATLESVSPREQECCYDNSGNLISGTPNGGSIKKVSIDSNRAQHFVADVRPFLLCCAGLAPNCASYYTKRPSDNGARFNPPTPAWIFGDPHLITLDGIPYTFSGYGEFTLIETPDDSFTLQGRMVPLQKRMSPLFNESQGTVLSAIAARVGVAGTRLMVNATADGTEVYVDDLPLSRQENIQEHIYAAFSVTIIEESQIVRVRFTNGVYLECQVSTPGFMSRVIIGVPRSFMNRVRGLLGVFNGIPEDDLTPSAVDSVKLPADSNLFTLHQDFGLSWLIDNISRSLFTYSPYVNLSDIYDPTYQPLFDLPTNHTVSEMCDGEVFCVYDTLVTGDVSFGQATLSTVMENRRTLELVAPVTCDPPCSNGACIPGNQCSCPQGYSGERCHTPEMEDCGIINPCNQSERCFILAGSYHCVSDCITNPFSDLCTPTTSLPSTNTLTIIIAAASVVGGATLFIIFLVVFIILCVMYSRRDRGGKYRTGTGVRGDAEGHYNSKTVVGATSSTSTVIARGGTSGSRKISSNTLPPAYSELEMDAVQGGSRKSSEDSYGNKPHDEEECDYENLRFQGPPQTAGQQAQEGSLAPLRPPRGHMVISISPESEESSGSPHEVGNPNNNNNNIIAKTTTNRHFRSQGQLSTIEDESAAWYRTSTPSGMSQDYSPSRLTPTSPTNAGDPGHHSISHNSLQIAFSNPVSLQNGSRPHSCMSNSAAHQSNSMGRQSTKDFSRSVNSMGKIVEHSRHRRRSEGTLLTSISDHFTDV